MILPHNDFARPSSCPKKTRQNHLWAKSSCGSRVHSEDVCTTRRTSLILTEVPRNGMKDVLDGKAGCALRTLVSAVATINNGDR